MPPTEKAFPDGKYLVSKTDRSGLITYANDAFVDISGFSRAELIGQRHNIVRHPDMPAAAFADLWGTVRSGRPWRGIVKNRCKNGDFYWVNAVVVPIATNGTVTGYMSVRTKPTRQEITAAEALYRGLGQGRAKVPRPSAWRRIPLRSKLAAMAIFLIVAHLLGGLALQFGSALGLSADDVNWLLRALEAGSVAAGIALITMQGRVFAALGRTSERLNNIAEGRLTDVIPLDRCDELGRIDDSLTTMQTRLKTMLDEIAEASRVVLASTGELGDAAARTQLTSEEQSEAVTRIAANVEQLNAIGRGVSDSAEAAAQAVKDTRCLIGDAAASMADSREASRRVVSTVAGAGTTMDELFQSLQAVSAFTHTIQEIAEQTNLLALNAAIEAARAGESGRGFAVVADEVRKLAERVSTQTGEISRTVATIQGVTRGAVGNMESAGAFVNTTDQAMALAEGGLKEVQQQETEVARLSDGIVQAAHEQFAAGSDIVRQVDGIVAGIERTVAAIGQVRRQADEMRGAADQLHRMMGQFELH